jgi:hypothetical protein
VKFQHNAPAMTLEVLNAINCFTLILIFLHLANNYQLKI